MIMTLSQGTLFIQDADEWVICRELNMYGYNTNKYFIGITPKGNFKIFKKVRPEQWEYELSYPTFKEALQYIKIETEEE